MLGTLFSNLRRLLICHVHDYEVQYVIRVRFVKDYGANRSQLKVVVIELCEASDGHRRIKFRRRPADITDKELHHHLLWKSTIGPWLSGEDFSYIPKRKNCQ
jgi:hypothetical protein